MDKKLKYDETYWTSRQFKEDCSVEASDYVAVKPYRKPRVGTNPLTGIPVPMPFLEDIYVPTPGPIDDESKRRLRLFYSRARVNRMEDDIEDRILHWMAGDDHTEPLMLIGDVGVGKSAFIRYFFLERVDEHAKLKHGLPDRQLRWGIVDHLHREKQSDYDNCQAQLSKVLDVNMPAGFTAEAALGREIKAFQSQHSLTPGDPLCDSETFAYVHSMTQDTETWNQCRMRYLDGNHLDTVIYVLLDNIDPCDPEEQMKIYALVRSILISHHCIRFIVCLRPDTAQMGKIRSRLWETSHSTVDIGPVDIAEMLRLRFAKSLEGEDLTKYSFSFPHKGRRSRTVCFPDILEEMLRPRYYNEYDIASLIQDFSCGKARFALDLVRMILTSPHLLHWDQLGSYHNTVQIWLQGNNDIFIPSESIMLNVFDNDRPEKRGNALIRCRVLQYFGRGEQDIDCFQFERHFRHLGYPIEDVRTVVQLLIEHDLLHPGPVETTDLSKVKTAKITTKGTFYLRAMLSLSYAIRVKKNMLVHRDFLARGHGGQYTYISDDNFIKFIKNEEECEKRFFLERLGEFYNEADWERTAEPIAPRMEKEFRDAKNRIQEALVVDTAAEELSKEIAEES